jgi:F420 biosynthesis protein FbiB-like protein
MQARINLVQAMSAEFEKDLTADGLEVDEINQRLTRSRDRILQAPVAIVLCYHPGDMDSYTDSRRQHFEDLMGIQSTALAGGTLLLAAHAEGLGGVWMCAPIFAAEAVRGSLGLPPEWQPQALLLLGYPARQPETPSRVAMNSIIYRINP